MLDPGVNNGRGSLLDWRQAGRRSPVLLVDEGSSRLPRNVKRCTGTHRPIRRPAGGAQSSRCRVYVSRSGRQAGSNDATEPLSPLVCVRATSRAGAELASFFASTPASKTS